VSASGLGNFANGRSDVIWRPKRAGNPHGPWRIANRPALSFALPNVCFDSLDIPRLTVSH
jgi:hypothetical protein